MRDAPFPGDTPDEYFSTHADMLAYGATPDPDEDEGDDSGDDDDAGEASPKAPPMPALTGTPKFESDGDERIQKILARVGYGSRRKCEELVLEGRVEVNGQVVSVLGAKANLSRDVIKVDGERVKSPKPVCYIINKPKGWYCTDDVPDKKILDLIPGEHPRLFTVGRLDKS